MNKRIGGLRLSTWLIGVVSVVVLSFTIVSFDELFESASKHELSISSEGISIDDLVRDNSINFLNAFADIEYIVGDDTIYCQSAYVYYYNDEVMVYARPGVDEYRITDNWLSLTNVENAL